jgi:hypothetical protein
MIIMKNRKSFKERTAFSLRSILDNTRIQIFSINVKFKYSPQKLSN